MVSSLLWMHPVRWCHRDRALCLWHVQQVTCWEDAACYCSHVFLLCQRFLSLDFISKGGWFMFQQNAQNINTKVGQHRKVFFYISNISSLIFTRQFDTKTTKLWLNLYVYHMWQLHYLSCESGSSSTFKEQNNNEIKRIYILCLL